MSRIVQNPEGPGWFVILTPLSGKKNEPDIHEWQLDGDEYIDICDTLGEACAVLLNKMAEQAEDEFLRRRDEIANIETRVQVQQARYLEQEETAAVVEAEAKAAEKRQLNRREKRRTKRKRRRGE
jgi:hypothetical protein